MTSNSFSIYRRLLRYAVPYWKIGVIMIIATAIYSSTNAIYAAQLKTIIDDGFIDKDMGAIYTTVIILVFVTFCRGLGFFVSSYTSRRISSDIVLDLRQEMFAYLQRLPASYFDRVSSGETVSRFNYDVLQITDAATQAIIILIREGVLVIVLLGYLLYQNWTLTLLILALVPVIGLIVNVISKRLRLLAKRIQGNMGAMNHILDENIKGQSIVKIHAGQAYEKQRFSHAVKQIRQASIKSEIASASSTPIVELFIVCIISLIVWLMALEAKQGNISPGEFLSYIIMIGLLPSPIKKLMRVNEFIQRGLAASEGIFRFLDEIAEPSSLTEEKSREESFKGELQFIDVSFAYEKNHVLTGFNLHIQAKETIALVGASGSGKSSLAALIPRFYNTNDGSIILDGKNIADLDLNVLRQQIAFVNQDVVLFNDTITRNIAYGITDENIDMNLVYQSARQAQAEDFILAMEKGYDSQIGESGLRLSGGQKQRLAIARAIYKSAPIIILDEATSALDSESERKVQIALEQLMQDRTAIVIAHRLSTIRNVDRILVLDKGFIVEAGTHDELMAKKGRYFYLNQTFS